MSTPASPHPASPVTPTRQQLDELDALLQRMLALPVNHLDENTEAAPPGPSATATETLAPPAGQEPEPWQEPAAEPTPEPVAPVMEVRWRMLEEEPPPPDDRPAGELIIIPPPEAPPADIPPVPPAPEEVRLPPPEEPKRGEEPPASPPPARPVRRPRLPPRSGPLWQRPLVWGNRAFDRATEGLGPPGVWLRRPAGRTALGWAGLVFLAAAAALVLLARIGWTW